MSIPSSELSRSFRSEIHATDWTCSGWRAKIAATHPLLHVRPVIRTRTRNKSSVFATWRPTLTRWCAPAWSPKSWQSSMWDHHVSGSQLPSRKLVRAQREAGRGQPLAHDRVAVDVEVVVVGDELVLVGLQVDGERRQGQAEADREPQPRSARGAVPPACGAAIMPPG